MRRHLALATLLTALAPVANAADVAAFGLNDPDASVTVELWADRSCRITTLDKATTAVSVMRCTYWIHGSRVRLRVRGEKDGEGFNALEIEHDPQSDALLFHGSNPKLFTRRPRGGEEA
ncbi:hypothetical protein DSM104443_01088 [Usitatibacter rugosus]|uniref:Uncharacterized protein n=1 Tax=Usitatibacter rugosus TaxID=2732067 RepID=A0A6M4GWR0_9PROT|nr:hypothetical protein [Usitatibacter rugosus]QJR10037.1 hypothetical protein DSM104443_01088 [Usitatibacter rugosus]